MPPPCLRRFVAGIRVGFVGAASPPLAYTDGW